MKNNFIIFSIVIFLISCSTHEQDKSQQESMNQSGEGVHVYEQNKNKVPTSESLIKTPIADSKDTSSSNESIQKTICVDQDISEWYGFKEQDAEDAQCKPIKDYKVVSYQCEMRPAFEEGFEAMFVLASNVTIISYPTLDKCNAAKDIWESNSP